MPTELKIYDMTMPGAKEKFAGWIANRGGIAVWPCVNLSNLTGPCFTPALASDLKSSMPKPGWQYGSMTEVVTDLSRFRFAKEMKEVKRFRVGLRMGGQGLSMKLADGATRRLSAALEKHEGATYRFDYGTQEAVIEVPVWE